MSLDGAVNRGGNRAWPWAVLLALAVAVGLALVGPGAGLARADDEPMLRYCYQGKVPESRLVVVDKSRQRIMVLRYMGEMMLEQEYPCATGAKPGHKQAEGDERTPVGIYFTTHRYQDKKITIFGDRAIHLNYPNPFDRAAGRQGNGIYIHGTNQKLKPRSSNGCITMRNQDLAVLEPLVTEQLTPIVVVERLNLEPLNKRVETCKLLRRLEDTPFRGAEAQQEPYLSLDDGSQKYRTRLNSLAPRLAGLDGGGQGAVQQHNRGLILLGLGGHWVLVADQTLRGPGRKLVRVGRRFYLNGDDPMSAQLMRADWVVPNLASAKRLAAWAPKVAVASKPKPKPLAKAPAPAPAPAKTPEPAPAAKTKAPAAAPEHQVVQAIQEWLKAWGSKDLRAYMAFYAPNFRADDKNRREWRQHKAYLNKVYKEIEITARDLKVRVDGSQARVTFEQHYRSDWHRDVGIKHLVMVKRGGRWQIVSETWDSLPGGAGGMADRGSRSS